MVDRRLIVLVVDLPPTQLNTYKLWATLAGHRHNSSLQLSTSMSLAGGLYVKNATQTPQQVRALSLPRAVVGEIFVPS